MDKTVNTFLKLNKYTKVCEVANLSGVLAADSVFLLNVLPWVWFKLLDAKRHLALVTVKCKNLSLYYITNLNKVLSRTQVL